MTKRAIISLACKIFGVVVLVGAIQSIPNAITSSMISLKYARGTYASPMPFVLLEAGSIVLAFVLALILIESSDGIAQRMTSSDSEITVPTLVGQKHLVFCLAIQIVGIVFIVKAIPKLIGVLAQVMLYTKATTGSVAQGVSDVFRTGGGRSWILYADLAEFVSILIIALFLLFYAKQLARFVFRKSSLDAFEEEEVSEI